MLSEELKILKLVELFEKKCMKKCKLSWRGCSHAGLTIVSIFFWGGGDNSVHLLSFAQQKSVYAKPGSNPMTSEFATIYKASIVVYWLERF
jgi:hypothetical protein